MRVATCGTDATSMLAKIGMCNSLHISIRRDRDIWNTSREDTGGRHMARQGKQNYTRLTQPLVRDNGILRPASWDEALDRAAEGFSRNLRLNGRTATGIFSCSKSTNEV